MFENTFSICNLSEEEIRNLVRQIYPEKRTRKATRSFSVLTLTLISPIHVCPTGRFSKLFLHTDFLVVCLFQKFVLLLSGHWMRQLIYSLEKNVIMFPLRRSVLLDRLLLRCESHNIMQIFEHRNEYIRSCLRWQHFWSGNAVFFILRWEFVLVDFKWQTSFAIFEVLNSLVFKIYESSQGNQVDNQTWFDATLVYRFNECNRRSYNL